MDMSKAKVRFCASYCMTHWYISATFEHTSMTQFYDLDKSRYLFSIISLGCSSIAWQKYLAVI